MPTFKAPLIITDDNGIIGSVVGPQVVGLGGNPAGVILADGLFLYGGAGVNVGPQRIALFGEPGLIELSGDDGARLRLEAGAQITISDSQGNTRIVANAAGAITVSDQSGYFSVVIDGGTVQLLNTSPGFSSSILLEATGRLTVSDALGNTAAYNASGWSVTGDAGCSINGGNLSVSENVSVQGDVTVQGDIRLPGADCAEQFDVSQLETPEPGTVMVVDDAGVLSECTVSYDRRVVGIVSGAGEYRPGIVLDQKTVEEGRAPIALVGKVRCKATAEFAPIGVGDLLTTSTVPGHAMRADDPSKAFGAVLGKALEPLADGAGFITVLVALQ